jgi:hypothetical protein
MYAITSKKDGILQARCNSAGEPEAFFIGAAAGNDCYR